MLINPSFSAESTDSTTSLSSSGYSSTLSSSKDILPSSLLQSSQGYVSSTERLGPGGHERLRPQPSDSLLQVVDGSLRRTRSLRERTGVDERLERIPTALCHTFSLPGTQLKCFGKDSSRNRPVKKKDFAEHVSLMAADADLRFSIEFEELKNIGRSYACHAGERAGNKEKNRFNNVLPFDHTRVPLLSLPLGCDYINANYIPGNKNEREFIATQGPVGVTVNDFWTMIWEQETQAIVNLSKCVERGKEKCARYWPKTSDDHLLTPHFKVSLGRQTECADWCVRELELRRVVEENPTPRLVVQFHFFEWPDFETPPEPKALLDFIRLFRTHTPRPSPHPIVVHCSAGIGRTGTFIILDRLLAALDEEDDCVDIFGQVYEIRQHRISMVQTQQQYEFIHRCVLQTLSNQDPSILGQTLQSLHLSPPEIVEPSESMITE